MRVQDIDMDHKIWGKSVPALKVKNTRKKPIPLEGDMVQVPKEMVKLHKYIYIYIWRQIFSLLKVYLSFSTQAVRYVLQLSIVLLTEKWRLYSRPSKRSTVITWSVGFTSQLSMQMKIFPTKINGLRAHSGGTQDQYHKWKWTRTRYWTPNQSH